MHQAFRAAALTVGADLVVLAEPPPSGLARLLSLLAAERDAVEGRVPHQHTCRNPLSITSVAALPKVRVVTAIATAIPVAGPAACRTPIHTPITVGPEKQGERVSDQNTLKYSGRYVKHSYM